MAIIISTAFAASFLTFLFNLALQQLSSYRDDLRSRLSTLVTRVENLRDEGTLYFSKKIEDDDDLAGHEALIKATLRNISLEIERIESDFSSFRLTQKSNILRFRQALTLEGFEVRPHRARAGRIHEIHTAADDLVAHIRNCTPKPLLVRFLQRKRSR